MAVPEDASAELAERFEHAVKVIQGLPKDGPFQPSNQQKLKFYSFYKQAKEGPCTAARPGFWDQIARYKYDAWHSLGNMGRDDAMNAYIADLMQIVETMPLDDRVQAFIVAMRPKKNTAEPAGNGVAPASPKAKANGNGSASANSKAPAAAGSTGGTVNGGATSPARRVLPSGSGATSVGSVASTAEDERDEFYDSLSDAQISQQQQQQQQQQQGPPAYTEAVDDEDAADDGADEERQDEDDDEEDEEEDEGAAVQVSFASNASSVTGGAAGGRVLHASTPKASVWAGRNGVAASGGLRVAAPPPLPQQQQQQQQQQEQGLHLGASAERLQYLEAECNSMRRALDDAVSAMQLTRRQLDELRDQHRRLSSGGGASGGAGGSRNGGGGISMSRATLRNLAVFVVVWPFLAQWLGNLVFGRRRRRAGNN